MINEKDKKYLENLSPKEKDELFDIVSMIENQDHDGAMKTIDASKNKIADEYKFSHFTIKSAGSQTNTPDPTEAMKKIIEKSDGYRLEVTAVLKNPKYSFPDEKEYSEKSILYVNASKEAKFLEGKEISEKIDKKLSDILNSYAKKK
jgi:hypothetical protein